MKKLLAMLSSFAIFSTGIMPVQAFTVNHTDDTVMNENIKIGQSSDNLALNQKAEYNIYPIPTQMKEKEDILYVNDDVNLVLEETVNEYTQTHIEKVLKENGINYQISDKADSEKTNIMLGIADGTGQVDEYFENVEYDASISTDKEEGYVLDVDFDKNSIAILGHENVGASYGSSTLDQMLEQSEGNLKEVLIEDSPETQFRGYIEGFYGDPWSFENRASQMEFCGKYKMNTYIYGPKDDPYHAKNWRDPYPEDKLQELKKLVDKGKETNVEFVWAIHVGGKIDLGNQEDIQKVKDKFDQLYGIGVRQFAVFFDDSATDNKQLVSFMNDLQHNYVDKKGDMKSLVFCPQYYNKKNGNEAYLKNLRNFDKRIQIMWTGDFVVSEINQDVVDYIVDLIDRPVYIWWNYPVNDLGRSHLLHMGPTEALAPNIKNMSGFVSNPMNQAQCSKVSLFSIANYTWNSKAYDSQKSWEDSWERIITDNSDALTAFKVFAQNCAEAPLSFSYTDESTYLVPYFDAFKAKYYAGEDYTAEAKTLAEKFREIRNAIEVLQNYSGTNQISNEMKPWMETMDLIAEAGEYVMINAQTIDKVNKNSDASIIEMMNFIETGREKLKQSDEKSKKCAQRRLYPFIESVLDDFEDSLYPALNLESKTKGFGSKRTEYASMIDGYNETYVELGAQGIGDYFGVDLGRNTNIKDIHIQMTQHDEKEKQGYYKEGVLEYSTDKSNWIEISKYDQSQIDIQGLDIEARFIRYRATDIFEDITNGLNISNVRVNEFSVNHKPVVQAFTNVDELNKLDVNNVSGTITFKEEKDITLNENEYIGMQFNKAKVIFDITNENDALTLETSLDGKIWTTVEKESGMVNGKYIRVINHSQKTVSMNTKELSMKNGAKIQIEESITEGGKIYSGKAKDTVDNNRSSALWFSNASGAYIEYTFPNALPIGSMNIYCEKDVLVKGHIEISEDGDTWKTIYSFNKASNENAITLKGEKAKKLRLYCDKGSGWVKINEVSINVLEDMNVIQSNEDASSIMDRNVFSAYDTKNKSGEIYIDNVNTMDKNTLIVIKNEGTTLQLQAKINDKWQDCGQLNNVYNEFIAKDEVDMYKLSWDSDSSVEINEVAMRSTDIADYSKVDEAIAKANALDPEDYVDFSAVEEAIAAVVRDLDITKQEEVDAMAKAIENAIDALEKKLVDKTELEDLVDKANKLDEKLYIPDNWDVFEKALEEAKEVLADKNATEEDVKNAIDTLTAAINGLKLLDQKPTDPETPDRPEGGEEIKPEGPGTGDVTNLPLLFGLLGASGLVIGHETKKRKRK